MKLLKTAAAAAVLFAVTATASFAAVPVGPYEPLREIKDTASVLSVTENQEYATCQAVADPSAACTGILQYTVVYRYERADYKQYVAQAPAGNLVNVRATYRATAERIPGSNTRTPALNVYNVSIVN